MGLKIGVVGAGGFVHGFVPLFRAHPAVDEVCLAELDPERRRQAAERHGIGRTFASLDELCRSDVDAVALFTQRWLHGPQAVQALDAGKHVYSAVPAAVSLEEMADLVETVGRTGLVYMMGETTYYEAPALYCRERFRAGDFGRFVYGEGEYLHDLSDFYESYRRANGEQWMRFASFPPMFYPTHSLGMLLSVTGAHATRVSCLGVVDEHPDGVFRAEVSAWGNVFSNETALFRTSDGGVCRINEFRRIGVPNHHNRISIYGTDASYEEQIGSSTWVTRDPATVTDVAPTLASIGVRLDRDGRRVALDDAAAGATDGADDRATHLAFRDVSWFHPVERLPREFAGLTGWSHPFLVDDFVRACADGRQPALDVWTAARYTVPGIVAHESAKRDGESMAIPDFGELPA